MNFLLTLVLCSGIEGVGCMPPHVWPNTYDNLYDCLQIGYAESVKKLEEIGREDVNDSMIHIKFYCTPIPVDDSGTQT